MGSFVWQFWSTSFRMSHLGMTLNHRSYIYLYAGLQIGSLISQALARVGRAGVVTQEESRTAEDHLYVVEGMQFDRGYISPYFVTDPERMVCVLFFSISLFLVYSRIACSTFRSQCWTVANHICVLFERFSKYLSNSGWDFFLFLIALLHWAHSTRHEPNKQSEHSWTCKLW